MAIIYCIENLVNGKRYVGETTYSLDKRWGEHVRMSRRAFKHRPLYAAINKYGVENFTHYVLEECEEDVRWEREQYWIQKLNTFHFGYNATRGGDGTTTLNISQEEFIYLYEQKWSPQEMAEYFNCSTCSITNYAKKFGVHFKGWKQRHDIVCIGHNFKKTFYSAGEAAKWLVQEWFTLGKPDSANANIMRCCKKQRASAYGFVWKFLEDE